MTGLEVHKIKHLSPSSISLWKSEPALWLAKYLLKMDTPVGCAAHRGTAIEHGLSLGLFDPDMDVEECQNQALLKYDVLSAFSADSRREKERLMIPGSVALALSELRQYGVPTATQGKIVHRFDGLPVDIMGYFDFEFAHVKIVVDLKTTGRVPSEITSSHKSQIALYIQDTDYEGRICYTSDKKLVVYRLEDAASAIAEMVNIGNRINKFLSISSDPYELASFLTPRLDEFWWNEPAARAIASKVYGM